MVVTLGDEERIIDGSIKMFGGKMADEKMDYKKAYEICKREWDLCKEEIIELRDKLNTIRELAK